MSVSKNEDIKFIQLQYTDVPGRFLAKYIARHKEDEIASLYKYGIGFDGSSVRGFAEINESDLMLIADKSTSRTIPSDATMISKLLMFIEALDKVDYPRILDTFLSVWKTI
jgi:glutamine synthetase